MGNKRFRKRQDCKKMAEMVKTEEILGQKWDKCVLDAGIKMSSGLAIGAVLSLVLYRALVWPIPTVNKKSTKNDGSLNEIILIQMDVCLNFNSILCLANRSKYSRIKQKIIQCLNRNSVVVHNSVICPEKRLKSGT